MNNPDSANTVLIDVSEPFDTSSLFQPDDNLHSVEIDDNMVHGAFDDNDFSKETLRKALDAISAVAYHWDIKSDEIVWIGKFDSVFDKVLRENINSGRDYAALLDPDNVTSRFETVMRTRTSDRGAGVPFSIEYSIKPRGRDHDYSTWIEDHGRWFAGTDGRPAEVYGMVRKIDDRHQRDQHLRFLGNCDPLTGLMNRGRLAEALGEAIETTKNNGNSAAFLIATINNLRSVNNAYGFDVADEVVTAVARRLRNVVRGGDVIGRFSGSRFGMIMNECTTEELEVASDRFLSVVRDSVIDTSHGPVWAMLSIGAVIIPEHAKNATQAMARAEEATAIASQQPADCHVIYKPDEQASSERKLNSLCATEIVSSLKEDRFVMAYQPIADSTTGEIVYHEALLRMKASNDDDEIVAAAHLIPIAEQLGLVRLIDRSVMGLVVSALLQYPDAHIAVNVSGITATDPRWFGQLTDLLQEHREVTERMTVEITETAALNDMDQTVKFVDTLHELGCKVAIDDFGVGYTSFQNLKLLKVDKVKIDGSFIQNLSNNPDNQYFVQTLVELAKKLNIEVVAEWVENEEDASLLRNWGVDYFQGKLHGLAEIGPPWGEPVNPAEDLTGPNEELMSCELAPENTMSEISADLLDAESHNDDEYVDAFIPDLSEHQDVIETVAEENYPDEELQQPELSNDELFVADIPVDTTETDNSEAHIDLHLDMDQEVDLGSVLEPETGIVHEYDEAGDIDAATGAEKADETLDYSEMPGGSNLDDELLKLRQVIDALKSKVDANHSDDEKIAATG